MTAAVRAHIGGEPQTYVSPVAAAGRPRRAPHALRNDAAPPSVATAGGVRCARRMLEGPGARRRAVRARDRSSRGRRASSRGCRNRTLTEIAYRALRPYTRAELDATTFEAVVVEALNFPIPLVEVEPGIFALELFHGPTLAFKDVGARTMARLMASLDTGDQPLTVLAATSGDTGSAVAHAFHGVPHTRVVVLYPEGRVSPTQEAQLTMFNAEDGNVRAYAVAGSFDDCQRLTKEAFADAGLRQRVRLTSANSVNIGRLLPQMVYYFHAVAQAARSRPRAEIVVCTPSGNFGNLTAGLMAKRAGLPIARFVAATNANDVVPAYLETGVSSRARRCRRSPTRWTSATQQLRAHAVAVRRRSRRDAPRHRRQPAQRRRGAGDDQARLRGARLPARSAQRDRVPGAQGGIWAARGGRGRTGGSGSSWRRRIRRSSARSSSRSSAGRSRRPRRWRRRWRGRGTS